MHRTATTLRLFLAALALCALPAAASAQETEPVVGFAGWLHNDFISQTTTAVPNAPAAVPVVAYDNSTSPALFAVSSTHLAATWGDELLTIDTGLLSELILSVYNSSSSVGALLTAQLSVSFFDGVTTAYLGGFTTNVNWGAGLPAGYYSMVTVTGLDLLGITLPVSDVIVTQSVVTKTGTANRLGIVSLSPPSVGTSPAAMYVSASTIGGGVPGWYTYPNPADPGYRVTLMSEPVPATGTSWGRLKSLYR